MNFSINDLILDEEDFITHLPQSHVASKKRSSLGKSKVKITSSSSMINAPTNTPIKEIKDTSLVISVVPEGLANEVVDSPLNEKLTGDPLMMDILLENDAIRAVDVPLSDLVLTKDFVGRTTTKNLPPGEDYQMGDASEGFPSVTLGLRCPAGTKNLVDIFDVFPESIPTRENRDIFA